MYLYLVLVFSLTSHFITDAWQQFINFHDIIQEITSTKLFNAMEYCFKKMLFVYAEFFSLTFN